MELGFFTMPIHPLDKDWCKCLAEDREAFLLADELGYVEAYVGEHVTDKAENITISGMTLTGPQLHGAIFGFGNKNLHLHHLRIEDVLGLLEREHGRGPHAALFDGRRGTPGQG